MKQMRDSNRLKRGGGSTLLALDFEEAERELAKVAGSECPEDSFDKEWVRSLFAFGLQKLRERCESEGKMIHLALFERYDLNQEESKPSYAQLAAEFGLAATDVTNILRSLDGSSDAACSSNCAR
jgi:hypothetical protein